MAAAAKKEVGIRLVAENGERVKAALKGVGDAGEKAFGRIEAKSKAMKVAATAAVAGMVTLVVGRFKSMVSETLETVDSQAKLAHSLGTTVESMQVLQRAGDLSGVSMGEIEQATMQLTKRLSQAAAGTGPAAKALQQLGLSAKTLVSMPLDKRIATIQDAIEKTVPASQRAAVAAKLFGDRAGLVFTRIDTSTLKQATKDVEDFGIAVSDEDAEKIESTNDSLSRMQLIWTGIANQVSVAVAPALKSVADTMSVLAAKSGPLGSAIGLVFGNLGKIAAFLGSQWLIGFVAARTATLSLAGALGLLKTALLRTGIGAAIVLAGQMAVWFAKLVKATGGWGEALSLLGDVASEAWEWIVDQTAIMVVKIEAGWKDIQAAAVDAVAAIIEGGIWFANRYIGIYRGAFEAIKSVWKMLPGAIADAAISAANGLIKAVTWMLNQAEKPFNLFITGLNKVRSAMGKEPVELIGEVKLPELTNPFKGKMAETGKAAAEAFMSGFQTNTIATPTGLIDGLHGSSDALRSQADDYRTMAGWIAAAASKPMTAWAKLKSILWGATEESAPAVDTLKGSVDDLTTSLDKSGDAGKKAGKKTADGAKTAKKATDAAAKSAEDRQKDIEKFGEEIAGDIVDPIKSAVKQGEISWSSFATSISNIFTSLSSRLIDAAFKPLEDYISSSVVSSATSGGWVNTLFGSLFANGGAFVGGREVTAFAAGGVVSSPTVFPMAKGIGLMGEAGPEAIMPLTRGSDGKLGVKMTGSSGSGSSGEAAAQSSTRIVNVLDPSIVGDYLATSDGEKLIVNTIRRNRSALS